MEENFKDPVTAAFYKHLRGKMDAGELEWRDLMLAYSKSRRWLYNWFYGMRSGHQSVTIEQLLVARDEFRVDVGKWFK